MNDDTWHLVKNTPKGHRFVGGTATSRRRFPKRKSTRSCSRCRKGGKPRPKVLFEVGEMVRVKDGPFTDFHGSVEDVNYERTSCASR